MLFKIVLIHNGALPEKLTASLSAVVLKKLYSSLR